MALDEVAPLQAIDHAADRRTTDAEVIGEPGLGRGTELGDVPDEAGLGEVEVERHEPGVERLTDEARGGHQRRFDAQPRRGVEFVVGQAAHGSGGVVIDPGSMTAPGPTVVIDPGSMTGSGGFVLYDAIQYVPSRSPEPITA